MNYDVIVIGGGLGGLTAGAKLAREGRKVLLIEQHNRPGGCATTFRRKEFTLEVGLHEMDGPGPRDMKTKIFNDLGVTGNIEFLKVPEFYRFINGRYAVTIPHDPQEAAARLSELFPDEKEGIARYFGQILNPKKRTAESEVRDISVGEFLDSIIKNEDLKLILLGNLGYFHDDPYTLSLAYYSHAQGSYYSNGASFIRGGSQRLSDYLAGYIQSHGGTVVLNHIVTGIIVEGNRAKGVVYRRRNDPPQAVRESFADEVIANNSMPAVADMLPPAYGTELKNEFSSLKSGASLLTVYFGFSRPLKELGHNYYSIFVYDESVKSPADIAANNRDDFSRRSFTFVDYGQLDSELAPAGKDVGALCCIDYLDDWMESERKQYDFRKVYVAQVFMDRLEKIIPGFRSAVEYYEVGTPSTVRRYTLNPDGAVYGFAQNPGRKVIDTFRPVENLHFASAWGKTGGGFSGAIYGGYLCAINILRKKPAVK